MPPKSRLKQKGRPSSSSGPPDGQGASSTARHEQTRDTLIMAAKVIEAISDTTDLLKPLKATCQVLRLALETTQAINDNTDDWNALESKLKSHLASLEAQCTTLSDESGEIKIVELGFFNPLKAYIENVESLQDAVLSAKSRQKSGIKGLFKRVSGVRIEAGLIRTYTQDLDDHFREFLAALQLFVAEFIQRMDKKVDRIDNKFDRILPSADANALNNLEKSHASRLVHDDCLPGTRVPILQKIREWADEEMCEKRIFWLNDVAGSGKSTIASTIANEWKSSGRLGGCFFFSMSDERVSGTTGFCSSLARDLHAFLPALKSAIQAAATSDTAITTRPFDEQFTKLIFRPLREHSKTVVLVIDAVDECKLRKQREEMLRTLVANISLLRHLKIFVTSRPEPDISAILSREAVVYSIESPLHGVEHKYNVDDITTYIEYHLSTLLTDQQRAELVEKAGGLFIWASTARKILEESPNNADVVMGALLSPNKSSELTDLDSLYQLVLRRALPTERWQDILCSALAVLAVVNEPVSVSTLGKLMSAKGRVEELVGRLGSVLRVDGDDELIHFRHPTFREYLQRCDSPPLHIDTKKAHIHIAVTTLRRLSNLQMDVLGVWEENTRVPLNDEVDNVASLLISRVGELALYSARFWSFHSALALDSAEVLELVKIFLKKGILNWLELVSWMKYVQKTLYGLVYLRKTLEDSSGSAGHALVRDWVDEVARFAQTHQVITERGALHVHLSAILFSPHDTWIYNTYKGLRETKTPNVLSGIPKRWLSHQILAGHSGGISCLAFSPDGKRAVSGSHDETLRLWDADTGAQIGNTLEGHSRSVLCLAFSSDGKRVVSGSEDTILRLWDADTGAQIGNTLEGHSQRINCLAFSPDGKRIVSGSYDMTLRLWDADTGAQIGNALKGHSEAVICLAFSSDGKRVVSGSNDKTLRLWDAETGAQIGDALEGHSRSVWCLAFSPDGKRIVSGSYDMTLRIWDAKTGAQIGNALEGHSQRINCLAFSPDGKRVVSGSWDNTLRLWDADTGAQIGDALEGHSGPVLCLAFSPDGKRIISSSWDETMRLWDADTGAQIGDALEGHSERVSCLAFSPDGKRIVSGSDDRTLRLWDADTGAQIGNTLEGHSRSVLCLEFSPDGKRIVSGSYDMTLRLWDVDTGAQIGSALKGHSMPVQCLAFSPDGNRVVSGSWDNTLRLWDADTGAQIGSALEGHSKPIQRLVFSPDGKRVVSVSYDKTLRVWDVEFSGLIATIAVGNVYGESAPYFSSDSLSVCFEGRKWHVSRDGLTEHYGQIFPSSGPPIFSPMEYKQDTHTIRIIDMPEHIYFLPLDFSVEHWRAHGGVMAFGARDGRVMIIDSSHLLRMNS